MLFWWVLLGDGYGSAPAAYRAIDGDFLDLQALNWHGNVVLGDVVRGELGGVVVEDVRRQPCGQNRQEFAAVAGVDAKFAANHRHSTGGVRARHVVGEVEVKEYCVQRAAVRGCFCGERPTAKVLNVPVQLSEIFALRTLTSCVWPLVGR